MIIQAKTGFLMQTSVIFIVVAPRLIELRGDVVGCQLPVVCELSLGRTLPEN
jgi:hypothetical protein